MRETFVGTEALIRPTQRNYVGGRPPLPMQAKPQCSDRPHAFEAAAHRQGNEANA